MRLGLRLCLVLAFALVLLNAKADEFLKFGLFPYVSPARLISHHERFIKYLESRTGKKIQLITSPDFDTFRKRTQNKEFDIILTAPHFGRLAELQSGYQRIAMTQHQVQGIYLVKPSSAILGLKDLKGKSITIAAPTSIVYRLAVRQLRDDYGLVNGKNITIITTRTHNNAMYSVIKGESEAAVTGLNLYTGLLKREGPVVRKIGETPKVPGFMLMANPSLPKDLVAKLHRAAIEFSQTEAGKTYVFTGYKDIDDATMKSLDAYISDLR